MEDADRPPLVRIEFDGGLDNYDRKTATGTGYGSYAIDNAEPIGIKFSTVMNSNAAELLTLLHAVYYVKDKRGLGVRLHVVGDSRNALKWVALAGTGVRRYPSAKSTTMWKSAIACAYTLLPKFAGVTAEWQPRKKSVKTFGH